MLQNQVVVITGASSGIGAAAALALAQRGARLCLLARAADKLAEVAEAASAQGAADVMWQACDIRDESAVNAAITAAHDRFGRIDALINNAGLSLNGAVNGYALDDWRTVIETNLTGTFLCCRAVLPFMLQQAANPLRGQIINLSSGGRAQRHQAYGGVLRGEIRRDRFYGIAGARGTQRRHSRGGAVARFDGDEFFRDGTARE